MRTTRCWTSQTSAFCCNAAVKRRWHHLLCGRVILTRFCSQRVSRVCRYLTVDDASFQTVLQKSAARNCKLCAHRPGTVPALPCSITAYPFVNPLCAVVLHCSVSLVARPTYTYTEVATGGGLLNTTLILRVPRADVRYLCCTVSHRIILRKHKHRMQA